MKKNGKPGVVVYFELRPAMKRLTAEQKGILFEAIMDYADDGIMPEFDDIALQIVWDFVQPRLDDDNEKYSNTVNARQEAANKRWGKAEDSKDANASECNAKNANAQFAMQTMPTTTTTTTTTKKETKTKLKESIGEKRARFSPPSPAEVDAYAKEQGINVNGQRFCDFYAAKGWKVGNTGMKDWKAAARNWASRDNIPRGSPQIKAVEQQQYTQRTYAHTDDAMDRMMADFHGGAG